MQPENETPTEPIQAQSQKDQPLSQAATPETHKSPKTPWAVAAVASIAAIAGIAFGVYGMMKPAETANTDNLKVQIKNTDGTTTTLETDKIEKTDSSGTSTIIVEAPKNIISEAFYAPIKDTESLHFVQEITARSFSENNTNSIQEMVVYATNGELKCGVFNEGEGGSFPYDDTIAKVKECDLSAHSGSVVDLVSGTMGNGGDELIMILNSEGEIEYINKYGEEYTVLKKLDLPKKVARIYGDSKIKSTTHTGNGAYFPTLQVVVQYIDGTSGSINSYFDN